MSPEQLELVAATAAKLDADSRQFGQAFYERLFHLAPDVRAMFPADMTAQSTKLVDELVYLVGAAGDLERFLADARELGLRHAGYGVAAAHFGPVEEALVFALEQALGTDWTEEAAAAWHGLYWLVAESMQQGVSSALFS